LTPAFSACQGRGCCDGAGRPIIRRVEDRNATASEPAGPAAAIDHAHAGQLVEEHGLYVAWRHPGEPGLHVEANSSGAAADARGEAGAG
jgi:hypothetical protein